MKDGAGGGSIAGRLGEVVQNSHGRLLSCLIGQLGDFDLAEDCLQDAIESAIVHWRRNEPPAVPEAWLLKVARRKAIDRLRRKKTQARNAGGLAHLVELDQHEMPDDPDDIPDERLRLIFTCCHPALDRKSSVALTLRMLGGLSTPEISRAFLDQPAAMAQRIVRAKRKIRLAGIPYAVPGPELWSERLDAVLHVIYLIFNEGYAASDGRILIRPQLVSEAIRLARMLCALLEGDGEAEGLLALLLLHDSRRVARIDRSGVMVPLDEQDRTLWDREMIAEGDAILISALRRGKPGPFLLQAAISAVHASAMHFSDTDWPQIVLLYGQLFAMTGNPVVRLNRAVALSYVENPRLALAHCSELVDAMDGYQPFHACMADLMRRCGDKAGAAAAYRRAIALAGTDAERKFLEFRLGALATPG